MFLCSYQKRRCTGVEQNMSMTTATSQKECSETKSIEWVTKEQNMQIDTLFRSFLAFEKSIRTTSYNK